MGTRAAIYCRISDDRDGDGLGVERQHTDCLALIERNGWSLVDTYTDNSVSAYGAKERPAWRQLLEACVEGRIDAVVAFRDDRLWRDVVEERQVSAMLAAHGVGSIAFASGRTYNPGDVDDAFTSGIHALVAEHESAVKAVRTRRALEQRALEGRWLGGLRPFGYRRPTDEEVATGVHPKGSLVVVPDEADVYRECAQRVLAGESLNAVVRDLNDRGIPTSRDAAPWRPRTLRELLTNPLHAGLKRHRGEIVGDGLWDAVIDRATHDALAALFASRKRDGAQGGRPVAHLLSGILTCYRCGQPMRSTVARNVRMYRCHGGTDTAACGGPSVSAAPADEHVASMVLALLADSEQVATRMNTTAEVDLAAVSTELVAAKTRRDELVGDYYAGDVPKSAYLKARARVDRQIDELNGRLRAGAPARIDAPVGDRDKLDAWWKQASTSRRRALVEVLVERIDLRPWEPSMGRRFSPDRLDIVWRY